MTPTRADLQRVPSVEPVAQMPTDVEAAHRGHAHAVERIRGLEQQLATAFEGLHDARQELIARAGVSAVTDFTDPVRAAWDNWLAAFEVGEMRAEPTTDEEYAREREAEALRIANAGDDS